MNSDFNKFSETQDSKEKAFPLPEKPPAWQDKKRTLMCLLKWEPWETLDEFAERVVREHRKAEQRLKDLIEQFWFVPARRHV